MHVPTSLRVAPALLGVAVLALNGLSAPPAAAAGTTMGAVFVPDNTCSNTTTTSTILQTASPGNASTVPEDGVITSWSFTVGAASPTTASFRLGRASGATSGFDIVGASPKVAVFGQSVVNEPVRIPAHRGDRLGIYIGPPASGGTATCGRTASEPTYAALFSVGDTTSGPLNAPNPSAIQIDVAATLEPDADRDGFGDLSQDRCASDPGTQGVCTAPDTSATVLKAKKTKKPVKKAVVTFVSSKPGSTFECAISSPVYRPCTSPLTVKAKSVKQILGVRAVDAVGVIDRTAATVTIKAKKSTTKGAKK